MEMARMPRKNIYGCDEYPPDEPYANVDGAILTRLNLYLRGEEVPPLTEWRFLDEIPEDDYTEESGA